MILGHRTCVNCGVMSPPHHWITVMVDDGQGVEIEDMHYGTVTLDVVGVRVPVCALDTVTYGRFEMPLDAMQVQFSTELRLAIRKFVRNNWPKVTGVVHGHREAVEIKRLS